MGPLGADLVDPTCEDAVFVVIRNRGKAAIAYLSHGGVFDICLHPCLQFV